MGKSLVIVESPAKARTINKYLGNDFVVKSSVGHIRDLPTAGTRKHHGRKGTCRQGRRHAQAVAGRKSPAERAARPRAAGAAHGHRSGARLGGQLRDPARQGKGRFRAAQLAENADTVYLATDLDREGEAIAWHLREAIGGDDERYQRVVFNEITKKAIQEAFSQPSRIDQDRVNAQQARRFLDRVVGYMVSPLLWAKVARGLSPAACSPWPCA
jgi:DNA topoisomerase-1